MTPSTLGAAWRFAIIVLLCGTAAFGMVAVFGQFRFGSENAYRAEFSSVTGLTEGNFVRIAGVEVGKVTKITIINNTDPIVDFEVDRKVVLTKGTRAAVRYQNLTGERYLTLLEGAGEVGVLSTGGTIPKSQTSPALDLDSLIGGLKPLFRALNPDQMNTLTSQLIGALQGEGPTIESFLQQAAVFTNTLADRDELIGQVIDNLHTVLSSISAQSEQLDTAVTTLSDLVKAFSDKRTDVSASLSHLNGAAATLADLLAQARPPLTKIVNETDRTSAIIVADHDYFTGWLDGLLPAYQKLSRQGLYGDFLNVYLCEVVLKLNGKGGQPTYVRVANQDTGRCAPR